MKKLAISSGEKATEILHILGIDPDLASEVTITIKAGEPITVKADMWVAERERDVREIIMGRANHFGR